MFWKISEKLSWVLWRKNKSWELNADVSRATSLVALATASALSVWCSTDWWGWPEPIVEDPWLAASDTGLEVQWAKKMKVSDTLGNVLFEWDLDSNWMLIQNGEDDSKTSLDNYAWTHVLVSSDVNYWVWIVEKSQFVDKSHKIDSYSTTLAKAAVNDDGTVLPIQEVNVSPINIWEKTVYRSAGDSYEVRFAIDANKDWEYTVDDYNIINDVAQQVNINIEISQSLQEQINVLVLWWVSLPDSLVFNEWEWVDFSVEVRNIDWASIVWVEFYINWSFAQNWVGEVDDNWNFTGVFNVTFPSWTLVDRDSISVETQYTTDSWESVKRDSEAMLALEKWLLHFLWDTITWNSWLSESWTFSWSFEVDIHDINNANILNSMEIGLYNTALEMTRTVTPTYEEVLDDAWNVLKTVVSFEFLELTSLEVWVWITMTSTNWAPDESQMKTLKYAPVISDVTFDNEWVAYNSTSFNLANTVWATVIGGDVSYLIKSTSTDISYTYTDWVLSISSSWTPSEEATTYLTLTAVSSLWEESEVVTLTLSGFDNTSPAYEDIVVSQTALTNWDVEISFVTSENIDAPDWFVKSTITGWYKFIMTVSVNWTYSFDISDWVNPISQEVVIDNIDKELPVAWTWWSITLDEWSSWTINISDLLSNSTDNSWNAWLSFVSVWSGTKWVTSISWDIITFTPNDSDVNWTDTISYTIIDQAWNTWTWTISIDITPVNDAPIWTPEAGNTTSIYEWQVVTNTYVLSDKEWDNIAIDALWINPSYVSYSYDSPTKTLTVISDLSNNFDWTNFSYWFTISDADDATINSLFEEDITVNNTTINQFSFTEVIWSSLWDRVIADESVTASLPSWVNAPISVTWSVEYRINWGAWTNVAWFVVDWDVVETSILSSTNFNTKLSWTQTIIDKSASFDVTTMVNTAPVVTYTPITSVTEWEIEIFEITVSDTELSEWQTLSIIDEVTSDFVTVVPNADWTILTVTLSPWYNDNWNYINSFKVSDWLLSTDVSFPTEVIDKNRAALISNLVLPTTVNEWEVYTWTFTVIDLDGDSVSVTPVGFPPSLSVNNLWWWDYEITWTLSYTSSWLFTWAYIEVDDWKDLSTTIPIDVEVINTNRAPVITSSDVADTTVNVWDPITFSIVWSDPDADSMSLSHNWPASINTSFDSETNTWTITWTPTWWQTWIHNVDFILSDWSKSATTSAAITVNAALNDSWPTISDPNPVQEWNPFMTSDWNWNWNWYASAYDLTISNLMANDPDGIWSYTVVSSLFWTLASWTWILPSSILIPAVTNDNTYWLTDEVTITVTDNHPTDPKTTMKTISIWYNV